MRMTGSTTNNDAAASYFLDPVQQRPAGIGNRQLWRRHFIFMCAAQCYGSFSIDEPCKIRFFDFCRVKSSLSLNLRNRVLEKMVEAAGLAPASSDLVCEPSTCVAPH